MCVEVRDPQKGWVNPKNYRNESWDLLAYCVAGTLTQIIGLEHIDFTNPPTWAEEWDHNDLVFDTAEAGKAFDVEKKGGYDLSSLGSNLA
jgi:phage terminase large subunit GpA-like protein